MSLAWRNLIYDRVRLAVTLTGIVFAIVLIVVQFGLFLGFQDTNGNIVAHSGADVWICAPGTPHLNGATPIPESRLYKVLGTAGVATAQKYIVSFVNWKLPDGGTESAQIVGFDLETGLGGPWNITQGTVDALQAEDTVFVDELYSKKLGVPGLGHWTEINGKRARVVGFTRGIRSFTTAPYIYTSFKNAQNYALLREDQTAYILVKATPGTDPQQLKHDLDRNVPAVDVYTIREFRDHTVHYWVLGTGAGITSLIGAVLGFIVGVVVVTQTIYAATVDHLREFGTLKAMGATNGYINKVIVQQAVLSAAMGYCVAIGIAWFVARSSEAGEAVILLPWQVAVATFGVALVMCTGAAIVSIRKATTIDPAMVFKA